VSADHPFKLTYMFHPSIHVFDLDDTEAWYQRVFGRSSTRMAYGPPPDPDNRMDYSTFTMIRDVLMDSIDPKRFVKNGKQQYPDIDEPHLKGFGWYVDGLSELWRSLRRNDIELVGLLGVQGTDDEPPTALQSSTAMFFATPDSVGLRYQFLGPMPMPWDPRMANQDWQLGPVEADDPLGIELTSHHTVLTDNPDRISRLLVDALGGKVIHSGRNEAIGMSSTYVRIADGVIEFGSPDAGTPARDDLAKLLPGDCYHAITFKVADLDKVRRHLAAEGVALRNDTGTVVVTDPATSTGIPFGFTEAGIPGDDRV
jgi:catechol 2,3-dioxygenase-like lactoylglutathione lyase family enzyme